MQAVKTKKENAEGDKALGVLALMIVHVNGATTILSWHAVGWDASVS